MSGLLKTGRFWAFVAVVAAMFYGFWGMFGRAMHAFSAPEEDMSFAWYVPLFSIYVLWTQRERLREALAAPDARPSWLGFSLCVPCVAMALLGARGLQLRLEQVAFIGLLIAVPWTFYGRRVASIFVFPAFYLVFTIPAAALMDMFTIRLRLLASGSALAVLNGCGIDAVQEGTAIISRGAHPFAIDVAEPCSGLRSLFALMALTAAYSWYSQPTWGRRAILFASSVPIAIIGNVVRIITICVVAVCSSADFALGFYHDWSGFVIFIVAMLLMVGFGEIVARVCERRHPVKKTSPSSVPDNSSAPAPSQSTSASSCLVPWIAVPFLAAVFVFQALTPLSRVMEAPNVALPETLRGCTSEEVRYCQNEQCARTWRLSELNGGDRCPSCGGVLEAASLGELTLLPRDTRIFKRLYRGSDGLEFLVSAVVGGTSKRSIHRPELCLPGQGFTMTNPREVSAGGRPFRMLKLVPPRGGASQLMAYTFFNQAGMRTASHFRRVLADTWDRSCFNRIDRWVMVTVHAVRHASPRGLDMESPADGAAVEGFLATLSEVLP